MTHRDDRAAFCCIWPLLTLLLALILVPMNVLANQAPIASAGDDQEVKVGALVRFGAGGSSDPDGDNLAYKWDFDAYDGLQVDSTFIGPTHTYTKAGLYTVTLTVTDGFLNTSDTMTVKVNPDLPPNVEIGQDIEADVNENIYFDARNVTDPNKDSLTYSWDFDASDGITADSTQIMAQWKYSKPGIFKVTLTVSDGKYKVNDTLNVTVSYSFEMVGGKGLTSTKLLKAGQKMVYIITLTKGRALEVKLTSNNGTKFSTYLFESKNYFNFEKNGDIVAYGKASKVNSTKTSYTIQVPKTDDYYLMVTNPSTDPADTVDYTISIKSRSIEGGGFIPGWEALELASSLVLVGLVIAMLRKRAV